jgi:hypothetical protein
MRQVVDRERIQRFMEALGAEAARPGRLYFTGGVTAVLLGWRSTTIDVDILMVPEDDRLLRALPRLKEDLRINIEIASPAHFIPELPGWQGRSVRIGEAGRLTFLHYDFYAQALSKIERGHAVDVTDVREMLRRGLIEPAELLRHFERIEPALYRYPAIDPPSFRRAVEETVRPADPAS